MLIAPTIPIKDLDIAANRGQLLKNLLPLPRTELLNDSHVMQNHLKGIPVWKTGTTEGSIYMVHDTKNFYPVSEGELVVHVGYKQLQIPFLPVPNVTLVNIWKLDAYASEGGIGHFFITNNFSPCLFFSTLLGHFGAVLSDVLRSDWSCSFWSRRPLEVVYYKQRIIKEFGGKDYKVYLVNFTEGTCTEDTVENDTPGQEAFYHAGECPREHVFKYPEAADHLRWLIVREG
jgi:hypothetical protein